MIIFLVLIIFLISLFGVFIYLNTHKYYEITKPRSALLNNSSNENYFVPNTDYFTLKDSWLELNLNSIGLNETCYTNITCKSGFCRYNPDTNQTKCTSTSDGDGGFTETSPYENESTGLYNYGEPYLYTAICSQRNNIGDSYYPDYKSSTLINETLLGETSDFTTDCENYTFQQTPLDTNLNCYDVDQLAGTKIVELCQASINSNQICINNNGDRVYSPELNQLYIKPSLTLCENNTSINYISFNYNKVPQTINVLEDIQEDGKSLIDNQLLCLSVDTVTYYPDFTVNRYIDTIYITFIGTWGFKYMYKYSNSLEKTISTSTSIDFFPSDSPDNSILEMQRRMDIDISFGITYKIPPISIKNETFIINDYFTTGTATLTQGSNTLSVGIIVNSSGNISFDQTYQSDNFITGSDTTLKQLTKKLSVDITVNTTGDISFTTTPKSQVTLSYGFGDFADVIKNTSNEISTTISLKPCAMFDSSYSDGSIQHLDNNIDKQKFKVSRFTTTDGKITPDENGIISSIVYRNLNYENGGLYLDYYAPHTGTSKSPSNLSLQNDQLVLRKIYPDADINISRVWLLMPPMELSPYTLPSGNNMWCNFCSDISVDGGRTFNNKNKLLVPMLSNDIQEGTEIIDPDYKDITKQPNNKIFNAIGKTIEGVASVAAIGLSASEGNVYSAVRGAVEIYNLTKNKKDFNWINNDPSFSRCSMLCSKVLPNGKAPTKKAVALNSGTLGSIPPGFSRGITQEFANGDELFGQKVGGTTCQNYYIYNSSDNPSETIANRDIGETYNDGNVEFIVQGTYNNTYLFQTEYFNNKGSVVLDQITDKGSGYGVSSPPTNVIRSLKTETLQKFIYSLPSINDPSSPPTCTSSTNLTSQPPCVIIDGIEACQENVNGISILNSITSNLSSYKWHLSTDTDKIPITIKFGNTVCDNPTFGLENFYLVILARIDFALQNGSKDNIIDITESNLSELFPTVLDTSKTSYIVSDDNGNKLFDNDNNPLKLEVEYGSFNREYRLYMDQTFVAIVKITTGTNGTVENIEILEIIDETILVNINTVFELQEWWILETSFGGEIVFLEYKHPDSKGCNIKLKDDVTNWDILDPAPYELFKSDPLKFPSATQPISLLNNSVMRHGNSPQQIVYGGSFEAQNEYCYNKDETTCNSDPKCSFNENLGYCVGKTLIEYVANDLKTPFTLTQNFTPEIFNEIKTTQDSVFTDLTFFKSLQIFDLNYQEYNPMPNQNVVGAEPTTYYEPLEFINYNNQGVNTSGLISKEVKLGKFIPYQYFYPTSTELSDSKISETSTLNNNGNNFYVNLNYSQFIPYGKKSLYENGFTKDSDVPTF